MMNETTSFFFQCGAKSKKENTEPPGVRSIGVNSPLLPVETQNMGLTVAADISVLRAGPSKEDILRSAPSSLVKLSLLGACAISKQEFIQRSRERVKKVNQRPNDRKNDKQNRLNREEVNVFVPSERNKQTTRIK